MKRLFLGMAVLISCSMAEARPWVPLPNDPECRGCIISYERPTYCRLGWQWVEIDRWTEWEWRRGRWVKVLVQQWELQRVCR